MSESSNLKRDFFVSFNGKDRDIAEWISWVLEEEKYSVYFQDWDFRGNFVEHMNRAHEHAYRTLAVLSDNYFSSDFTLAEWSARFVQDPAGREDRLVPIKVGPITQEHILRPFVYADLTGCNEADARKRLLGRVRKAMDANYRDKPKSRPGFPGSPSGPPRIFPNKPSFPVYTSAHNSARKSSAGEAYSEQELTNIRETSIKKYATYGLIPAIFIASIVYYYMNRGGDIPGYPLCRHPNHGIESYNRTLTVTRESGWRGGGYSPARWCNDLVSSLRGEHPQGNFNIVSSDESTKNTCAPFNCPQYLYAFTVQIQTDPVYKLAASLDCKT